MPDNVQTPNSIKVYETAKECLGKNLCENRIYGCAETINAIFQFALGQPIGGLASTYFMYKVLTTTPTRFKQVTDPLPGDIIISTTGYGKNEPIIPNGHVGIVGRFGILSNNSNDGLLEENYTIPQWQKRYVDQGGYPMNFFRVL
jgi:hypothetical protein